MTLFAVQDGPGPRVEVVERGTYRKHSEAPRGLKRREAASFGTWGMGRQRGCESGGWGAI